MTDAFVKLGTRRNRMLRQPKAFSEIESGTTAYSGRGPRIDYGFALFDVFMVCEMFPFLMSGW